KGFQRLFQLSLLGEGITHVVMGFNVIRIQVKRARVMCSRLLPFLLLKKKIAQVIVRLGVLRLQSNCLQKIGGGLRESPLSRQGNSDGIVTLSMRWFLRKQYFKLKDGSFEVIAVNQCLSQHHQWIWIVRSEAQCFISVGYRFSQNIRARPSS